MSLGSVELFKSLPHAKDNNFQDFLFYDIEVFKEDSLVVFKDSNGRTVRYYHNNFEGLKDFINGKVLVGYNNYHYDDLVLTKMIRRAEQAEIKRCNDEIIDGRKMFITIDPAIFSLDVSQQIMPVSIPSLKKMEGLLGLSIDESKIPFNIDRKLTLEELKETIKYCEQDVLATIQLFKMRWFKYFTPKFSVIKMLDEEVWTKALRWNTTTIAANILTTERARKWRHYRLDKNATNKRKDLLNKVPKELVDLWNKEERKSRKNIKRSNNKFNYVHSGANLTFGRGGLHGVNINQKTVYKNVKLLDVTSLYPNIIININGLDKATDKYKEIVNKRVKVKHTDKVLSEALKLIINSTYGLLNNEYTKLYNPNAQLSVCIYGQIALYDLCKRLYEVGYTLININTDGVAFCCDEHNPLPDSQFKRVQKEWEEFYNLSLELTEFDNWYQKDVSNYIATSGDNIKVKGGTVKNYFLPSNFTEDPYSKPFYFSTSVPIIIQKCIVNKIVYNKPAAQTIYENLDNPLYFQYLLIAGNTYKGVYDSEGNKYQKVNRIFASKKAGIKLFKRKELQAVSETGETVTVNSDQLFPDTPENMYLFNDDLSEFDNFRDIVDVDFYINLANSKIEKLWD